MDQTRTMWGSETNPRPLRARTRPPRWRHPALAVALAWATIGWWTVPASAQEAPTSPGLEITDAHIEGSGPWTSWIGGAPDRTLVITILNTGPEPVDDAVLSIVLGKGSNPEDPVEAPELGRIDPGGSTTVQAPLSLPRFAVGTYRVEGTVSSASDPSDADRFQAETSHVPWMVFLLPLLILVQLILLKGRNAVRDRIHRAPGTSDPTLPARVPTPTPAPPAPEVIDLTDEPAPAVADLESVISEELDAVFDEAFRRHDEELDESQLTELVVELAGTAARRVTDRVDVSAEERVELHGTMTEALLAAFELAPPSAV